MAIYQGARVQTGFLPRRRPSRVARARRRNDPVGLGLAVILAAFLLGLVYLTQAIHAAGTTYDLDRLLVERELLAQQLQSLKGEVVRHGAQPAITESAQQIGLDPLGNVLRVPAR